MDSSRRNRTLTQQGARLVNAHSFNPLNPNPMNIIESTPINLGNDDCDIVNAFIYRTSDLREYKLVINYPVAPRITDEFSNDEIEALWSAQYPEWNDLLFSTL